MKIKNLQKLISEMSFSTDSPTEKNEIGMIFQKLIEDLPLSLNLETDCSSVALRGIKKRGPTDKSSGLEYYFELAHDESAPIKSLRGLELLDKERYKARIYTDTEFGDYDIFLELTDKKHRALFNIRLSYNIFNKFIL